MPDDLVDSDLIIKKQTKDAKGTGLTVDSVIRLHKIVTIPKNRIQRKLGSINKSVELEIKKKIRHLFDNEQPLTIEDLQSLV